MSYTDTCRTRQHIAARQEEVTPCRVGGSAHLQYFPSQYLPLTIFSLTIFSLTISFPAQYFP